MKKDHTIKSQLNAQFVEKRPYFWWWVRDKKALSVESVVEGVLAYMNIDNVSDGFLIRSRIFLSGKMRGPSFEYNIFSQ